MEPAHGPTMPRIARACHIRIPLSPAVTEATCARICNRAQMPHRRRFEAPDPNPEPSEWAIGEFTRAHPTRTAALSAAFGRVERRGCRATMDIRASGPPEAAAEAPRVGADRRTGVVVAAGTAATAGVDVDRSKKPWRKSILLTRKTAPVGWRGS